MIESQRRVNHVYERLKTHTENLPELIFYVCIFICCFLLFKKKEKKKHHHSDGLLSRSLHIQVIEKFLRSWETTAVYMRANIRVNRRNLQETADFQICLEGFGLGSFF